MNALEVSVIFPLYNDEATVRTVAVAALDLLQGSLHKNPSQRGYHLTIKVDQKTVTKYVRKELVPLVRAMTRNHLKVRKLLQRLSEANWRLLQLPPPD